MYRVDPGPITNGGLLTTRSNRRPATGAARSPASSSHDSPFSAAVVAANRSARGDRSVAVTRSEWTLSRRACTPQPVPISRAVDTFVRGVAAASVVAALPMPST